MIDIENYDDNNIFAKILKKEIPSKKIFENDFVYAFEDINPQAPVHILIIPKSKFCSFNDFCEKGDIETVYETIRSINEVRQILNLKSGYRIITNVGKFGCQEVPHLHFHLLSGTMLGSIMKL
jgi:diadenosine tetraphosphate (Ap4A) HIT family hydrolase